jgi:hypothetical protein
MFETLPNIFLQVLIPPGNIRERLGEKVDNPFKVIK